MLSHLCQCFDCLKKFHSSKSQNWTFVARGLKIRWGWPPVSIALSQLCNLQMRCSSLFLISLELAVSLCPVLWTTDHVSSIICRYLPSFYTGTNLHCLVTEARVWEQLAQGRCLAAAWPGFEPTTCWLHVWPPNHYTSRSHWHWHLVCFDAARSATAVSKPVKSRTSNSHTYFFLGQWIWRSRSVKQKVGQVLIVVIVLGVTAVIVLVLLLCACVYIGRYTLMRKGLSGTASSVTCWTLWQQMAALHNCMRANSPSVWIAAVLVITLLCWTVWDCVSGSHCSCGCWWHLPQCRRV